MKKVYMFLATGFQETEAISQITILLRTDIDIKTVSITGNRWVESTNGLKVEADLLFEECDFADADMLVMPGGMPGATNLRDFAPLKQVIMNHYNQGCPLAAICAAPIVYGSIGLLKGKRVTCYPGFEDQLIGAIPTGNSIEVDGLFITGKGPGVSQEFGFAIIDYFFGKAETDRVKAGMMFEK